QNETSPPKFSASGSGRCRAPGRVPLRLGASLSVTSDHDDRAIRPGRPDGRDRSHPGRGHADVAWSTRHHRECRWRQRQHRDRPGRPRGARRIHAGRRHMEHSRRERRHLCAPVRRREGFRDARLVRGRSAIAVLGSESCHWKTDEFAASSDEEVVGAAEPSMAMCHDGGLLMLGSSVYRKRGFMFRKYRELYGNDDSEDICWFAPSAVLNPKLPARVVERALAEDPIKARAEYLNVWRDDQASFLPLEVVEACTDWDVIERLPEPQDTYFAFADAAGGTGKDSYGLCITHVE